MTNRTKTRRRNPVHRFRIERLEDRKVFAGLVPGLEQLAFMTPDPWPGDTVPADVADRGSETGTPEIVTVGDRVGFLTPDPWPGQTPDGIVSVPDFDPVREAVTAPLEGPLGDEVVVPAVGPIGDQVADPVARRLGDENEVPDFGPIGKDAPIPDLNGIATGIRVPIVGPLRDGLENLTEVRIGSALEDTRLATTTASSPDALMVKAVPTIIHHEDAIWSQTSDADNRLPGAFTLEDFEPATTATAAPKKVAQSAVLHRYEEAVDAIFAASANEDLKS